MTDDHGQDDHAAVLARIEAAREKLLAGVEEARARCGDMALRREAEAEILADRARRAARDAG